MQPVNTPYAELVGDGSSTEIEFDFSVDIASTSPSGSQSYPRVRLITYDEDTGALESVETLTYGTDYTVALTAKDSEAGDLAYPGGTITLTEAPETYQTAYVDRVSPLTQSTIFPTGGQLNLRTLEAKLDYLTRIAQEQGLDISRIPVSDDPTAEPVLWYATEDDWGKYASLDLSGNAVFVTEVTPGNLTLTNQGDGRVGYGGATDEIRFDGNFSYDEDTDTLGVVNLSASTGITGDYLTASRVVVTNADKKLVSSDITSAELDYLANVTSDIQTQIDAKLATATAQSDYVRVLARTNGEVTCGNTTAKTTILSFTVPAGAIGINRKIRIRAAGKWSTDGGNILTMRLEYDGNDLGGLMQITGGSIINDSFVLEAEMRANNSATAQTGHMTAIIQDGAGAFAEASHGAASKNSANALTLTLSAQWNTADTSDTISLAAEAELI